MHAAAEKSAASGLDLSRASRSILVAHIAEVDERKLYAREASPSMFVYCTEVLHLSEAEAYLRIEAARASRKHPVLLAMLGDGRLHLTAIAKLAPYLTPENRDALLERATHRSKRQIEDLIAEVAPRPDVPAVVRKLPARTPSLELRPDGVEATAPAPMAPAVVQPLAPARYKVQFTASAELHDKLERLLALMPRCDLAQIIDRAVTEKLQRLEARRFAKVSAPRKGIPERDLTPSSRYISAPVRRAVNARDGGRCRYVDPTPWVVIAACGTSASCVIPTTHISPSNTTGGRQRLGTGVPTSTAFGEPRCMRRGAHDLIAAMAGQWTRNVSPLQTRRSRL